MTTASTPALETITGAYASLPNTTVIERVVAMSLADSNYKPTDKDIDECVLEYQAAQELLRAAQDTHDEVKNRLIGIVRKHGSIPDGASESKRLSGTRNAATVTVGKSTSLRESAIGDLREYLNERNVPQLFGRMFSIETKHKLVESAHDVLATVDLPKRTHDRIAQLFGVCIDVKTKAPVLKVDAITPEKIKRTKRGKAA
ncbi:hypothetical protein ACFQBQ_07720 [Granulicella cerasi]|uniref:Uncharacterized protein n=1 Tax=Granulicella cerasi TaxID=741063 RepID=A0ABW1Z7C0_9BACT|nr:hypothetical protein [Granulicella cerasi]